MKPSLTKSKKAPKKPLAGTAGPLGPPRLTGEHSAPAVSPTHFQVSLRESLFDLLWQQWAALGVAGHAGEAPDWIVDIEALILVTTTQGRVEPRLFDEMLDWLWTNAHWVNVQRLRNIRKRLSLGDARTLAAIADWLSQRTTLSKWKPLAERTPDQPPQPERFYLTKAGLAQPMVGPSDPTFLRHGFILSPIKRRELSRPLNPRSAAALSGKLRSLFGVQARCEILLWLLTHESGRPAEIARATFYFPRTVEDNLAGVGGFRARAHGPDRPGKTLLTQARRLALPAQLDQAEKISALVGLAAFLTGSGKNPYCAGPYQPEPAAPSLGTAAGV